MNKLYYYVHFKDEETKALRILAAKFYFTQLVPDETVITHSQSCSGTFSPNRHKRAILVPHGQLVAEVGSRLRLSFCTISGPSEGEEKEKGLWD